MTRKKRRRADEEEVQKGAGFSFILGGTEKNAPHTEAHPIDVLKI